MTMEDFEKARYEAILNVMKKDRAQYFELQKKYDKLLIDFQKLKRDHFNTVDACVESKHKLREQIKKLKEKSRKDYNKLLDDQRIRDMDREYGDL